MHKFEQINILLQLFLPMHIILRRMKQNYIEKIDVICDTKPKCLIHAI